MIEVVFLFLLGFIWLVFASIQDIRSREIFNWISFSLIIFALGFRFFYSLFSGSFSFFYQGLIGFGIFFVLGNLLYYSRMFAGGDMKLMVAMGPILGFSPVLIENLKYYSLFLFLFLFSGAIYGICFAIIIGLKNSKKIKKGFKDYFKKNKLSIFVFGIFGLGLCGLGFLYSWLFYFGIIIFIFPYLFIFAKTVDNYCMVKIVSTKKLTEGDWICSVVKVGKNKIAPSWDGLSKRDIKLLQKKYKKVKIKEGIAFVPVFLIAYLVYFYVWVNGMLGLFF